VKTFTVEVAVSAILADRFFRSRFSPSSRGSRHERRPGLRPRSSPGTQKYPSGGRSGHAIRSLTRSRSFVRSLVRSFVHWRKRTYAHIRGDISDEAKYLRENFAVGGAAS